MDIESQVVNLALAKRLKEMGVKQESLFYWIELPAGESFTQLVVSFGKQEPFRNISAFTASEICELIPKVITFDGVDFYYSQVPDNSHENWIIFYGNQEGNLHEIEFEDENEANARAEMLIYLLENNLMELKNES